MQAPATSHQLLQGSFVQRPRRVVGMSVFDSHQHRRREYGTVDRAESTLHSLTKQFHDFASMVERLPVRLPHYVNKSGRVRLGQQCMVAFVILGCCFDKKSEVVAVGVESSSESPCEGV